MRQARGSGGGGVEGDDGAVCEAGAFAEGCWCYGGWMGVLVEDFLSGERGVGR